MQHSNARKEGKTFGSISTKQIEGALKEKGYNIDRKKVKLDLPLSTLGEYTINIELHKKVIAPLKLQIKQK